jgi:hypothetical protein
VVSYNLLMLAASPLAGFSVYVAAWELSGGVAASFLAGLLFMVSGYALGQGQIHLNLAFCAAVPLCLWACLRAARRGWGSGRLSLVLGLLLAFQFGVSQELFASLVLFGGLALLLAGRAAWALLPGVAGGLGLCLLLISPLLWQMLRFYGAAQGNLSDPDAYGNDLLAAITPTPLSLLGGRALLGVTALFRGSYVEQGGYFGVPLLALLAVILWCGDRRVRVAGAVFALAWACALGPFVHVLGARIMPGPWVAAYRLPFLRGILPCRLALYGWLAACMMVAVWLARPAWRRYAAVLGCMLALAPAQAFDRHWTHLTVPGVFASLPEGARVLVLPEFGQEMGWQVASGMRFTLVGQGYLGTGRPAWFRQWAMFEPLWENRFPDIPPAQFAAYVARYQVQYIVILPRGYDFYRVQIDERAAFAQAQALVRAAGWRQVAGAGDALLFAPPDLLARY